jgi:carboxymethylenebutenolidase
MHPKSEKTYKLKGISKFMRSKLLLFMFIISLFLLIGCQAVFKQSYKEDKSMIKNHIGCAEKDAGSDKGCALAGDGNKNVEIFEKDVSSVITEAVDYGSATGFLAMPKTKGKYPAVVMIHEWWGLNENIKDMAGLLASEGYVILAVDLYGKVATEASMAGQLAGSVRNNPDTAITNMQNAIDYLKSLDNVQKNKIGSMGWCFGGQQSLLISLNSDDIRATVIYYGHLLDDKQTLNRIQWPVLGIFGEDDSSIPVESVRSFESAITELGIENEIHIYPGVGHAFANPSGSRYAPSETKDAWDKTVEFLNKNLK